MNIIFRHAEDDFYALLTAQGMEDAGASVFSIVYTGDRGMLSYVIAAKHSDEVTTDQIDKAITASIVK